MRITFADKNITVEVSEGMTIQQAQIQAGLKPDAPCGGKGTCGKCKVWLEGKKEPVLACQTLCEAGMIIHTKQHIGQIQVLHGGSNQQLDVKSAGSGSYGVAFDIGTTTIAAYLIDRGNQKILGSVGRMNPQIQFGADVISRIEFAGKGGADQLTAEIRKSVNEMIAELVSQYGHFIEDVELVAVAGNTCMNHLFLGISTESLVMIPYQPTLYEKLDVKAVDYGICIHPEGRLWTFPNIAGFVGGDTVACLLSAEFQKRDPMTLMIDIGTNGELVLGNREKRYACSTAAGPALEGAKISCGMRGAAGAVDHVWIEGGEVKYSVIGGSEAAGICGSGLLDLVKVLLDLEIIDETGAFQTEENEYCLTEQVKLTQRDVREIQLAKGAIAAGIRILCKVMGIELEEIEEVLIAGAFGNYMNPDSACGIGLIPKVLREKIRMIGNAAGEGCCQIVYSEEAFELAGILAEETEFVELASDMEFQDIFVDELEFYDVMEE